MTSKIKSVFFLSGRGAQVNEPEMIAVLRKRPDLMALGGCSVGHAETTREAVLCL